MYFPRTLPRNKTLIATLLLTTCSLAMAGDPAPAAKIEAVQPGYAPLENLVNPVLPADKAKRNHDQQEAYQRRANIQSQQFKDMLEGVPGTAEWTAKMNGNKTQQSVTPAAAKKAQAVEQSLSALKLDLAPMDNSDSNASSKTTASSSASKKIVEVAKNPPQAAAKNITPTAYLSSYQDYSQPYSLTGYYYDVFSNRYYNYHDYMDDFVFTYTAPNNSYGVPASYIQINFGYIELESGYDYVAVVDAAGYECARFTGRITGHPLSTACVGNSARIFVHTDGSRSGSTYYGFDIDGFRATYNTLNTPPIAIASASSVSPYRLDPVYFSGATSYDPDLGDSVQAYSWNFGDSLYSTIDNPNISTQINPQHYYSHSGTFLVSLTVWDSTLVDYNSVSFFVYVYERPNYAPTAIAIPGAYTFNNGDQVLFDGSASYDSDRYDSIYAYRWNFGDGTAYSTDASVYHYYLTPGTYLVSLTVWDTYGVSAVKSFYVTVNERPNSAPVAVAAATPSSPNRGQTVTFSGASSTDIDSIIGDYVAYYYWDFGDGTVSAVNTTSSITHYYANDSVVNNGPYRVQLTVWDTHNRSSSKTLDVTVKAIATPTALVYNLVTENSIKISWTAGSNNTAYKVVVAPSSSSAVDCSLNGVNVTTTTYTATGLQAGTDYSIQVCGYATSNSLNWFGFDLTGTKRTLGSRVMLPVTIASITTNPVVVDGVTKRRSIIKFTPAQTTAKYRLEVAGALGHSQPWLDTGVTPKVGTQVDGEGKISFQFDTAPSTKMDYFRVSSSSQ